MLSLDFLTFITIVSRSVSALGRQEHDSTLHPLLSQPTHFVYYTTGLAHEDIPPLRTLHPSRHWRGRVCGGRGPLRGEEKRRGRDGGRDIQREYGHQSLNWKKGNRNFPTTVTSCRLNSRTPRQTPGLAPFPGMPGDLAGRPETPRA